MDLCQLSNVLLSNMLSRLVVAFLPRSERLLLSWLQSPSAVILEPKEIKSATVSTFPPSICHEVMGLGAMIFVFLNVEFQASFFALLFHFHQELFSSSSLSDRRLVSSAYLR